MARISVLIPTFRRPDSFRRAAQSVFAQSDLSGVELIAIDNSPEGSALESFRALEAGAPIPFHWAHEPRPGVSHARNAALALARGRFIAWLDDDEEAAPHWLAALLAAQSATGAHAVFGPVRAQAAGAHAAFFENLYARTGPAHDVLLAKPHGIGNSLQPRHAFEGAAPFAVSANETGGEDDALFAAWAGVGARFAWAADALVIEHVGPERTRLAHALKRAFAYGQGPCELAWAARDYAALARHMSIGAGQMLIYGAASAACFVVRNAHALALLDRAARGAGKLIWFRKQRFYGAALAARQPA